VTIQELRGVGRTLEARTNTSTASLHSQTRIAGLDGIRGIAISAVIGCHTSAPFMNGGGIGVDIFFVLSGFLISRILIAEFEATGRIDFVSFYWRRFLRIAPALISVCIGWICVAPIFWHIALRAHPGFLSHTYFHCRLYKVARRYPLLPCPNMVPFRRGTILSIVAGDSAWSDDAHTLEIRRSCLASHDCHRRCGLAFLSLRNRARSNGSL
jgi:hypothetical protein